MRFLGSLLISTFFMTSLLSAKDVNGVKVVDVVKKEKELKLIGAGTRVKWFFDVYVMAAYAENKSCSEKQLISTDMDKYISITMLRDVSAEKMGSALEDTLGENLDKNSSEKLKSQVKTLRSFFTSDLKRRQVIEFNYIKGKGTKTFVNGEQVGTTLEGLEFNQLLWKSYFGKKACCKTLKKEVMAACKK